MGKKCASKLDKTSGQGLIEKRTQGGGKRKKCFCIFCWRRGGRGVRNQPGGGLSGAGGKNRYRRRGGWRQVNAGFVGECFGKKGMSGSAGVVRHTGRSQQGGRGKALVAAKQCVNTAWKKRLQCHCMLLVGRASRPCLIVHLDGVCGRFERCAHNCCTLETHVQLWRRAVAGVRGSPGKTGGGIGQKRREKPGGSGKRK
ncbi:hypothetical protein HNY73_008676 [Argiope bruennichi]|uniref:Uncharacterized protein n=1 Tax=Argiope bruennichi TaxID=94029 RepID=A0A8T0FCI8_ARGBR|nr:hypothetical protein HNY73_008676 [Argiope bruennichi]